LNKPNPEYDSALKEFVELCHRYHIKILADLFDNCQYRESWNAFRNNVNDIHNIYDYRPHALEFWKHEWIDRWLKILNPQKGDLLSLGNELRFPQENDVELRKEWAEKWGFGLAEYMIKKGVKRPIYFSASKISGHKLHGYISGEEHPQLDPGNFYTLSCFQIHGIGLPEHLDIAYSVNGGGKRFSSRRYYWNKIPENKRGICATGDKCCSANTKWRIETVKYFLLAFTSLKQVHSIEFLPREVAGDEPISNFNVKASAYIYSALAKKLWNVDIKRPIVYV